MNTYAARISRFGLLLIALTGCMIGCKPGDGNKYEEPPPQEVEVSTPLQHDVIDYVEETGTTEPFETVEIRARVEGYLEQIKFEPGQTDITPGFELYQIDQKPYLAVVTEAQAAVKVAEAAARDAAAKYERAKVLAPKGAMSQEEVMERAAAVEVTKAQIEAANAQLESAELDLSYTVVKSPISGRVGKTLVDKGNLVGSSMTTHLTTVISYDPIYASFNISERRLLDLRERRRAERKPGQGDEREDIAIHMGLENEKGYPHRGHLNYADLAVDSSSGTFRIRGVFDNPDFKIVSGLFVRLRIPIGVQKGALLVPESATGADQEGRYVWVIEEKDGAKVVDRRGVTLGAKFDEMRVVLSGLQPSDTIVVSGVQRVRPGSKVDPVMKELELPPELAAAREKAEEELGGKAPTKEQAESTPDDSSKEPAPDAKSR